MACLSLPVPSQCTRHAGLHDSAPSKSPVVPTWAVGDQLPAAGYQPVTASLSPWSSRRLSSASPYHHPPTAMHHAPSAIRQRPAASGKQPSVSQSSTAASCCVQLVTCSIRRGLFDIQLQRASTSWRAYEPMCWPDGVSNDCKAIISALDTPLVRDWQSLECQHCVCH